MVVDTAPVSKAIDLPTAGDEMVYSSLSSWPVPRSRTNIFCFDCSAGLVRLIVYRCAAYTCYCGKPNGLRSEPRAVVATNDERIWFSRIHVRHWLTSDFKEIVSSVTRLFGKNAHAAR